MLQRLIILILLFHFSNVYGQWINTGAFNHEVTCFASNDSIIFAGIANMTPDDKYIFLSSDDGLSWQPAGFSFNNDFSVASLINKGNILFIGNGYCRGIYVSMDDCQTIEERNEGIPFDQGGCRPFIWSFALNGDTLFAGTYFISPAIYRTTNDGGDWTNVLFTTYGTRALQISGENIYAGTEGEFYYSSDNGNNWEQRNINGSGIVILALAVKDSYVFAGTEEGVYRSSDKGLHWQLFNNGLTNVQVLTLLAHDSTIYLGTNGGGIFFSTNSGEQWISANNGLEDTSITSIYIYNENILAGSSAGRVWVHSLSQPLANASPSRSVFPTKYLLQQNYPNPFNPITHIFYVIPKSSKVRITIRNTLGQLVEILLDEYKYAGSYSTSWNAAQYPSGVYFCTLDCDNYTKTIKMVVIK